MASLFTGQVVLVVDGLPIIHCKSVDYRVRTNRELVVGMTPDGNPAGNADGTREFEIELEVYVPKAGDIDWESINGAMIGSAPRDGGKPSVMFTGFYTTEVSQTYQEKGAAIRKISGAATRKLEI